MKSVQQLPVTNQLDARAESATDPTHHATTPSSYDVVLTAVEAAISQKAHDIRALDLEGFSDVADYYLIASGTSDRHVIGIADKIRLTLKQQLHELPVSAVGYDNAQWILLDYGFVVIHIFHEQARHYFDIDSLWAKARTLKLPQKLTKDVSQFTTGIYKRFDS